MEQYFNSVTQSPQQQIKNQTKDGKIYISKIPQLKISSNYNVKDINFNSQNWVQLDKFKIKPFGASPISDRASTAMLTPSTLRRKVVRSTVSNSSSLPNVNLQSQTHSRNQSQQLYQMTNNNEQVNMSMTSPQNDQQQFPMQLSLIQTHQSIQQSQQSPNPFNLKQNQIHQQASRLIINDVIHEQKFQGFVKKYINENPIFVQHQQVVQSLENIPDDIKQTLDVLNIYNKEKFKNMSFNSVINAQTKAVLFSFLEKLQREILEQSKNRFHDGLINELIVILNDNIPPVIRQISDQDSHLAIFCEGFYKFFIILMDNIQSRLQYKIKREMNQKYVENEKLIQDQKQQIQDLNNEILNLMKKINEEQKNTLNIEGKLKEEIINLKTTIQEMKFNLEDMQNLDFAPTQLEGLAKTTSKMTNMIKKESIAAQQAEIKTESQLLTLSNVLLSISKSKFNDSDIFSQKNNFCNFINSKVSRLFGDHPFTKCLQHINFLTMQIDDKSPNNKRNAKQTLIQFFQRQLAVQKSESNPCDQLIEYLQNDVCQDYEDTCQMIGYIIYYLQERNQKDTFSYFFSQLFGIFEQPLPSREEVRLLIIIFQSLQHLNEEKKNLYPDNEDISQISPITLQNERYANNQNASMNQVRFDQINVNNTQIYNPISEFNYQNNSNLEFNMPLDTVFEEIPWNTVIKAFEQSDFNFQFIDVIKQKIQLNQISVVTFLSKLLQIVQQEVKDSINSQINQVINKFPNLSTNQQKINNPDLINLCQQFKIKHQNFVQYTLYLYQEELSIKQRVFNNNSAEITDNEFNDLLKNSFFQMIKLQKQFISPFIEKNLQNVSLRQAQTVVINEDTINSNNSLASNVENLGSSIHKKLAKSFNKIKAQNTLSRLGSKNNLESPLSEKGQPLIKLLSKQSEMGQTSPKKANETLLSSVKFSKFKK
ncbi:hypothetical protein TTHERM_01108540 (macronuclear) [Tetrahymena thermophila SB210]|uniref:Uncharacterized protein n=1 Tax=Tetrahymena thermophila (strain SB210) TaxID=312017 RepID=Q22BA1_TETTS|nr:hypothetical protein TTHERM_01108540 [Tetrahymena thermophila SB210]EAR82552.2 hypothetical protein TTHERM_01108540 [Tetrahymena thermophila SB210]|eukprot:XP_001030215.2 hypothetical protein TTHERM_01108540 [Tetrahymena thermophila SB210]